MSEVDLLATGSMTLVVIWLLVGGIGIPLPEEPALLGAGAILYHGNASPFIAVPLVMLAVLLGDLALYSIARRSGPALLDRRLFHHILPPHRRRRIDDLYRKHGGRMVFIARHLAGLRAATFVFAGIQRMEVWRFVLWDFLAACISVPLGLTLGYVFALHLHTVDKQIRHVEHVVGLIVLVAVLAGFAIHRARRGPDREPSPHRASGVRGAGDRPDEHRAGDRPDPGGA